MDAQRRGAREYEALIGGDPYHQLPSTPHRQTLQSPDLVPAALDAFLPAAG